MASEKISQLTPHTPNSSDVIPVELGGTNFSDTVGGIETAAAALVVNITGTAAGLSGTPALPSGTTAATVPNPSDASANVASDAFVQSAIELSMGTVPLNLASQGPATYSFACLGTGSLVNFAASGGAITSITILDSLRWQRVQGR